MAQKSGFRILFGLIILLLWCGFSFAGNGKTFRVASYNVQNLFDLTHDGTEYEEYIPGAKYSWNKKTAGIKYSNIARVISGLNADIVALQEVESLRALHRLKRKLKESGVVYPFWAISESKGSAVQCAVLSKFNVASSKELRVKKSRRTILKADIDVFGNRLIIYVNHWLSKRRPESARVRAARVLKREIETLPPGTDYLILGDFNSDYDECLSFRQNVKLNDTFGTTGINQILKTVIDSHIVEKKLLTEKLCDGCLYNLWLELAPEDRWSYLFFGKKCSPDSIIIPASLCDRKNINYVGQSFQRFMPHYLLRGSNIYRWKRTQKGVHRGKGFSDHLPVFADFKAEDVEMADSLKN